MNYPESNIKFKDLLGALLSEGKDVRFRANGFSMFPLIIDGDCLTISPLGGSALKVGSVVAFRRPQASAIAVHRIVGRGKDCFLIKGDNVSGVDGCIPRKDLLGFVSKVERGKRVVRFGLGRESLFIVLLSRVGVIHITVFALLKVMPLAMRKFLKRRILGVDTRSLA